MHLYTCPSYFNNATQYSSLVFLLFRLFLLVHLPLVLHYITYIFYTSYVYVHRLSILTFHINAFISHRIERMLYVYKTRIYTLTHTYPSFSFSVQTTDISYNETKQKCTLFSFSFFFFLSRIRFISLLKILLCGK